MPLPNKIQNAPELELGMGLFFTAFLDLTGSRNIGFGLGPIPWDAIDHYCNTLELAGDQREDLFYYVRALDDTYLEFESSKKGDR